jgi:hypothetical protein
MSCNGTSHDERSVGRDQERRNDGKIRTVYHKACRSCDATWDVYGDWY